MNDLFEIVEDLEDIDVFGSDTTAFEDIIIKWKARLLDAQDAAERQFELFEMDDGAQPNNGPRGGMVYTTDLKSVAARLVGSSPTAGTKYFCWSLSSAGLEQVTSNDQVVGSSPTEITKSILNKRLTLQVQMLYCKSNKGNEGYKI